MHHPRFSSLDDAEKALQASEQRFRLLLDSTAEAIYELDTDGRCSFANAACAQMLGFASPDDLIGEDMHALIHYQHVDGSPYPVEDCAIYQAFVEGEGFHTEDEVLWRKDGSSFPVELWSYPIVENDEILGAVVTFFDISERRERERLLEHRNEALQKLNRMNRALASNLETRELLQQITDFGTELTGAQIGSFFYNVSDDESGGFQLSSLSGFTQEQFEHLPRPRVTPIFKPIFEGERMIRFDDLRKHPLFGKNPPYEGFPEGHPEVRSALAAPVVSRDGYVYGGMFFGHSLPNQFDEQAESLLSGLAAQASVALDNAQLYQKLEQELNDRRRAEQRLERALEDAETSSRSKSEFLANMSHEIRTPMTAILGYADVVLSHLDSDETRAFVQTIKRNGAYLLEILNDILDLSKIEAGRLDLQRERVSPAQLIGEIQSLMTIRAREKSLDLQVEYDGQLPETILTDSIRLRQVLVNLVGNAIKFTERGQITLRVRLLDRQRPMLEFEVVDTGIGMSAEQQRQIFEPFTQADTSNTRQHAGTGLGLTICRRLVQMLGGEISVDSAPSQGSTFRFTIDTGSLEGIPVVEPKSGITEPRVPLRKEHATLDCRVLVADDHRDIRQLAKFYLETAGAEVDLVSTGAEAVEAVQRASEGDQPYHVVLMDMQMPAMNGFVATRTLRSKGFDVPIIAVTAAAMEHDRQRCLDAGCNAHVAKPVSAEVLVEAIKEQTNCDSSGVEPTQSDADAASAILLVEDNPDAAGALQQLLELKGFEVDTAPTGKAAIDAAQARRYATFLLDLGLPDMSGYQLLDKLRSLESTSNATFIALSGRGQKADKARSLDEGFAHHLVKPAPLAELIAVLPESPETV